MVSVYAHGTLTLIAKRETFYDDRGQVYRSKRYAVSSAGVAGNALTDNAWYDEEGNVLKSKPSGSQSFTKNVYDAISRTTASYSGYYSGSGGDTPDSIANDVIFEESLTTYDAASNVTFTTSKRRWHNATGNGGLNGPSGSQPKSRDSYTAFWYDGIGRQAATADYGTNDNDGAPTRPNSPPASSDTILVGTTDYDAAGNAEDQTDPSGQITRSTYDDAGRVTSVVHNHGSTPTEQVDTTYTADGQVKMLKAINSDTGDQTTTYAYGTVLAGNGLTGSKIASNDLLHTVTYPDSGVVTYEYNRLGQRIKMTDQNGSVHDYSYDMLGRQTVDKVSTLGTVAVDGFVRRIEWTYDNRNRLENISSYSAATGGSVRSDVQYEYDDFSQLKTEYQQHGSAVNTGTSPKVQYGYDDASAGSNAIRRESITYPDASVLAYSYGSGANDELSRVEKLTWKSADVATYDYLGLNQVVVQKYVEPSTDVEYTLATGSGTNPYAGLDRFGRIVDLQWKQGSTQHVHLKYGYDRASNRTYRRDEVARSNSAGFDELYGYDGLNRLTTMNRGTLNVDNDAISGTTLTQGWDLDATGNWRGYDQSNATPNYQTTRTHNGVNEITAITTDSGSPTWDTPPAYDANGNTTTMPQAKALGSRYSAKYDAWNRLVEISDTSGVVASYEYDGFHRRIVRDEDSTETHFYYNDQWQCLEERVGAATTASKQYVWGMRYVDDLVLSDASGTRYYYCQDANFNVVAALNSSGTVQERYAYTPYGVVKFLDANFANPSSSSSLRNEFLYTGRRLDPETGLYQYRHRFYHAQLGRFVNRDPIGQPGGPVSQRLGSVMASIRGVSGRTQAGSHLPFSSEYVDGMNLYAAYFVPNDLDPLGLSKACCKFRKGRGKPVFVEEVSCPSGSSFSCCRKRAEGWFGSWEVVDNVAMPCDQVPNDNSIVGGAMTVACISGTSAIPKPDPIPEEIPAAGIALCAVAIAGTAYVCGSRSCTLEFPDVIEDIKRKTKPPGVCNCFESGTSDDPDWGNHYNGGRCFTSVDCTATCIAKGYLYGICSH